MTVTLELIYGWDKVVNEVKQAAQKKGIDLSTIRITNGEIDRKESKRRVQYNYN